MMLKMSNIPGNFGCLSLPFHDVVSQPRCGFIRPAVTDIPLVLKPGLASLNTEVLVGDIDISRYSRTRAIRPSGGIRQLDVRETNILESGVSFSLECFPK